MTARLACAAAVVLSAAASASGLTGIDAQMQQLVDAADAARKQIADKAAAKSGETPILSFFGLGDMTTEQISAYMLSAMERVNRDLEAARSKLRATKAKEEQDAAIKQAESLSLELAAIAQKNADFEEKLWEGINKAREEENQRLQEEYMRNLEERKKAELDAIGEYARALSGAITQANQQQQSFINGQLDGIAQTVTKIQQLVQIKLGK